LYAKDPAVSAEFYRDILGMQLVGGSGPEHPLGATAFLSSRPDEESHEIALFANPMFAHIAFKVSSLAELRLLHVRVLSRKIPIKLAFNHGVSFEVDPIVWTKFRRFLDGAAGCPGGGRKAAIHSGLDSALGSHPCVALSSYQALPLYGSR
jgi:catechol 2,3-dioxygenase-like lactoylglutathione lyase family enzyme